MSIFEKKELTTNKRVCLRLKEEREKAGVNLDDLSTQTKISKKHLQALEECRFDDIPYASIYQKNFIKKYVQALNLPAEDFTEQFITEETKKEDKDKKNYKAIKKNRFQNLPSFIKTSLIAVVVLSLIGYLGLQVKSIIEPPDLMLFSPENGIVTTDQELIVHGKTQEEIKVYVNGKETTSESDGHFIETINLSTGLNTITVSAKKKHGKSTTITHHVTLKDNI
jgi:cytoskeletal protein RodZ